MDTPHPRTLTIREAAAATGLSDKALQRRIARGTLGSVLRDGRRLVPATELLRCGLLPSTPPAGYPSGDGMGHTPGGGTPGVSAVELLDRLQAQAVEIGELRALTRESESARLRASQEAARADALVVELLELRAKVAELEATQPLDRRSWLPSRRPRVPRTLHL